MPRTGRGGSRVGTPGQEYGNRTDLQQHQNSLPIRAATGQTYGQAQQQQNAQRMVPMAPPPQVQAPAAPPSAPAGPNQGTQQAGVGGLADLLQQNSDVLDQDIHAPTQRPDEPVTTYSGPAGFTAGNDTIASVLQAAAQATGNPNLQGLAAIAMRNNA